MMLPPDPVFIFKSQMTSVSCVSCQVTSDVERIYAGTQSGKVHVWNLQTKREISSFESGDDVCLSISILSEEEEQEDDVITLNKSGQISFWKEDSNMWVSTHTIQTDFFGFCKALIFQQLLYTSLKDCHCQSISLATREPVKTFKLSDGSNLGEIMALKVIVVKDVMCMLVAYEGHKVILWDLDKTERMGSLDVDECPMAIDYDTKTNKGICGNSSDKVLIFSLSPCFELKLQKIVKLVNAGVASVSIRPDSKLVAVGCWDGKLKLYSWKTLVLLAVLDIHTATLQDTCFMMREKETGGHKYLLVAGSKDSSMSLWDIYN